MTVATLVQTAWTVLTRGAGLRDQQLRQRDQRESETARQLTWLDTRMKAAASRVTAWCPVWSLAVSRRGR